MYDNICEFNITRNCAEQAWTGEYFETLGAKGLPYDQAIRIIAEKQIKKEFRERYLAIFDPRNVMREYAAGNNHLRYDFMISQDGTEYSWTRVDAHVF